MRKRCGRCRRDYDAISCPYCYSSYVAPTCPDPLAPSGYGPFGSIVDSSPAPAPDPPSTDTGGGFDGGGGDFGGGGASGEY